jgi:hypothetical protein
MLTTNKTNFQAKREAVEINDIVYLYNEGKHTVLSFTKSYIRFKCEKTGKVQNVHKNRFVKGHFFTKNGYWTKEIKHRSVNMDYI